MEKKYLWAIMVFTLLIFSGCGKEEEEKLKICIDATKQAEMEILVNDWKVMEEGADIEPFRITHRSYGGRGARHFFVGMYTA